MIGVDLAIKRDTANNRLEVSQDQICSSKGMDLSICAEGLLRTADENKEKSDGKALANRDPDVSRGVATFSSRVTSKKKKEMTGTPKAR